MSTRVFKGTQKVKIMLEINIKQIMVMLDLLNKSWPWQQLLVAWCVPNNHQCSIHSKTYYAVPTASCSDAATKREMTFGIPFLAHTQTIGDNRQHQTDSNIPSRRVMVTWLVQALI
jgi:hypothetical protein